MQSSDAEFDGRPLIGVRTETAGLQSFPVSSPVDGEAIGLLFECDRSRVDEAVALGGAAMRSAQWRDPRTRKRLLRRWAELIRDHAAEIASIQTREIGRPIRSSRADIAAAADTIDWFADLADKNYGEYFSYGDGSQALIVREPIGVVGAVVPWNFPVGMASWKLAPVLAMGNSIVLKPAEQSPFSILRIADLALEAGLPEGVMSVLPGRGAVTGEAIGLHPDIAAVTFTGSTGVGKRFLDYAARSNMKQVWLETGGKSTAIVLEDADAGRAAELIAAGLVRNTGQVCSANGRVLVHASVAAEFRSRLEEELRRHRSGSPLDEESTMGPLASQEHFARVADMVGTAIAEGDTPSVGALPENRETCYFEPMSFWQVESSSRLWRQEVFGPVIATRIFEDLDTAIIEANDTEYGLAGSVFSRSMDAALDVAHRLDVGSVTINDVDMVDIATPFPGRKQSGNSADLSMHSAEKFTALKTIWIRGAHA